MVYIIIITIIVGGILLWSYMKGQTNKAKKENELFNARINSFMQRNKCSYSFSKTGVKHDNDVLFIESNYDDCINRYISSHYEDILKGFNDLGLRFLYIHKELPSLINSTYARNLTPDREHSNESPMSALLMSIGCKDTNDIVPSLIQFKKESGNRIEFVGFKIEGYNEEELETYFRCLFEEEKRCRSFSMISQRDFNNTDNGNHEIRFSKKEKKYSTPDDFEGVSDIRFSINEGGPSDNIRFREGDEETDVNEKSVTKYSIGNNDEPISLVQEASQEYEEISPEDKQILSNIKEQLEQLRAKGIREVFLQNYLVPTTKVSRIKVTKDMRIILVDYDNLEIIMTPLPKSLYILYLRHPEGIGIKELSDHKQELMKIYEKVKGGMPTDRKLNSVLRLLNPLDNSVHEKLSQIKDAFNCKLNENLANHYIVQGPQREAKNIKLAKEKRIID